MKYLLIALIALSFGCSALKPKKTTFYKNDKPVRTFVGYGVFDGNKAFGTYKIWASKGWQYYDFKCEGCTYIEEVIQK